MTHTAYPVSDAVGTGMHTVHCTVYCKSDLSHTVCIGGCRILDSLDLCMYDNLTPMHC